MPASDRPTAGTLRSYVSFLLTGITFPWPVGVRSLQELRYEVHMAPTVFEL